MLGRGYLAGLDMREQRRGLTFSQTLSDKRMAEDRASDDRAGTEPAPSGCIAGAFPNVPSTFRRSRPA